MFIFNEKTEIVMKQIRLHFQRLLILLLILSFGTIAVKGQLVVTGQGGGESFYDFDEVKRLIFFGRDLRIIDNQGEVDVFSLTSLRHLSFKQPPGGLADKAYDDEKLLIYPNPANSLVEMQFESTLNGKGRMDIISAQGKVCFTKLIELETGRNRFFLELENLPTGVYICRITYSDMFLIRKFIKQ